MDESRGNTAERTEVTLEWRRAFEEVSIRLRAVSESLRRPDPAEMHRTAEELTAVVRRIEWLADVLARPITQTG